MRTYPDNWTVLPDYIIINLSPKTFKIDLALALKYHGPFNEDKDLVGKKFFKQIEDSAHFRYLTKYLYTEEKGLNITTIVIERSYTSLSYRADYLNYYGQTKYPYVQDCSRIHFFSKTLVAFNQKNFERFLFNPNDNDKYVTNFLYSYRGHIVIKKLPRGSLGASLISTYKSEEKDGVTRFYTALRKYEVNLFGKKLYLNTMPYQEQDSVIGYCATSALWFAFQITSFLFNTDVPNPSEITLSAGHDSNHTGKNFPRNGLELTQVCQAIFATGLVAELRNSPYGFTLDDTSLKGFIYAYLKMGLPVLLGIQIEDRGDHLITLNGYSIDPQLNTHDEFNGFGIELASDKITKFYAHDDQIGPFAKLEFNENNANSGINYQFISAWWRTRDAQDKDLLGANATSIIVPIIDRIKVIYEDILDESMINKFLIETYFEDIQLSWDIFLIKSNDYKKELLEELVKVDITKANFANAYSVFQKSLPQYIWVVKGYLQGEERKELLFDFIYDAADINYHRSPNQVNIYDKVFYVAIAESNAKELMQLFNLNSITDDTAIEDLIERTKNIKDDIRNIVNTPSPESKEPKTSSPKRPSLQTTKRKSKREIKNISDQIKNKKSLAKSAEELLTDLPPKKTYVNKSKPMKKNIQKKTL